MGTIPLPPPSLELRWEVLYLHSELALFIFRLNQPCLSQLNQSAVELLLKIFRAIKLLMTSLVVTANMGIEGKGEGEKKEERGRQGEGKSLGEL